MPLLPNNREHGWAPYVWLVFLSFFFFQPILNHAGLTEWLITIAATLVFGAMYFAIFWTPPWGGLWLAGWDGGARHRTGALQPRLVCLHYILRLLHPMGIPHLQASLDRIGRFACGSRYRCNVFTCANKLLGYIHDSGAGRRRIQHPLCREGPRRCQAAHGS